MKTNIISRIGLKRIVVAFTFACISVGQANLAMADTFSFAGSASLNGSSIQLTNAWNQSGAAWRDTSISTTDAFTAVFGFNLSYAQPDPQYTSTQVPQQADGIALVFQNVSQSALGSGGASIGVDGISNASGSAIQTWTNNRVGFFQPGQVVSDLNVLIQPAPFALGDAPVLTGTETITYDPLSHIMSMTGSINGNGNSYLISDTMAIDLSSYGSTVYIGFTGGSGLGGSDQEITDFRFSTTAPVPEPATMLLFGTGIAGLAAVGRRKRS